MQLAPDVGLMLWTMVTFGGLLVVLAKWVLKPLAGALRQREATIQGALDKAQQAREDAEKLLARNDQKLQEARDEARRIINEGHKIVAEMKSEARNVAKRDAETVVGQARSEIRGELQKGLDDLKDTVVNLSVRISRQVIKEQMDEQRHQQLADDFIHRLKNSRANRSP